MLNYKTLNSSKLLKENLKKAKGTYADL